MSDTLDVIIAARNEEFLQKTIESVINNARADTGVIAICDGYWPDPPVKDHPKVTIVHHTDSIGQRGAVNEGARLSQAKFIMKLDAHCSVDEGFDVKLMRGCEYDWTLVPLMYNLHAFDWECIACGKRNYQGPKPKTCSCGNLEFKKTIVWQPRWNRITYSWRFDKELQFQYWISHRKRKETRRGSFIETMSLIGACFFMHRNRFWELDGMDENHGSWGQVGTEIACKSWLSGGKLLTAKGTWFSHMFRTNNQGFSFPYPIRGKDVSKAKRYSKDLWLNNKWPKQKHKLEWLVERFKPVPSWHEGAK
jgi:glycosyltransferase involved in cell wall biosynthesis